MKERGPRTEAGDEMYFRHSGETGAHGERLERAMAVPRKPGKGELGSQVTDCAQRKCPVVVGAGD